jgi:hypothetical protein
LGGARLGIDRFNIHVFPKQIDRGATRRSRNFSEFLCSFMLAIAAAAGRFADDRQSERTRTVRRQP